MGKSQLKNGHTGRKPSHGTRRHDMLNGRPGRRSQSPNKPDNGTWPLVMDPVTDTPEASAASGVDPTTPIEELDLSVGAYNPLKGEGINNLGELIARTKADLLDLRNFGQKRLDEVKDKLRDKFSLYLKGDGPAAG
ncbi:MAG TPA: DNA-directed RNA polymerase subunit alpha C-terminal domain-containing protein [Candidatus Saccharimonadales bacterium]|nr:DNA-directed RNA polymerase subunit alpha C-terminal domain-containing protein [Candidatus Saccharimonadales bacterium]